MFREIIPRDVRMKNPSPMLLIASGSCEFLRGVSLELLLPVAAVPLGGSLFVNLSFIPFTYLVMGKTQLVPILARSGNANCGKLALVNASILGSN